MKRFQLPFIYSLFAISLILTIISITFRTDANQTWHSQLYPPNWTPGYAIPATSLPQYADRTDLAGDQLFLHDFSYAGYHFGEDEVPTVDLSLGENNPLGKTYNVVDRFGADNTGATDTSEAIQRAIDQAVLDGGDRLSAGRNL